MEQRTPRKYPRAGLITQVESRSSGVVSLGQTGNIGEGGMLVQTRVTFDPGTEVTVRFCLPSSRLIEAEGLVVHGQPSVRMGIKFTHLSEDDRQAIAVFVRTAQPYRRRSRRITMELDLELQWRDQQGESHQELVKTVTLSRFGGLFLCSTRFKAGQKARLWWSEKERGADIRFVFCKLGRRGEMSEVGFEFLQDENFWGIDFSPAVMWW